MTHFEKPSESLDFVCSCEVEMPLVYKVSGREPVKPYLWGGLEGVLGRLAACIQGCLKIIHTPLKALKPLGFEGWLFLDSMTKGDYNSPPFLKGVSGFILFSESLNAKPEDSYSAEGF